MRLRKAVPSVSPQTPPVLISAQYSRSAEALLRETDSVMARLVDAVGPFELRPTRMPIFECLAREITNQQLSRKAADTIFTRFKELFPNTLPAPEAVLRSEIADLRRAGLSRAKADYIRDAARAVLDGTIPPLEQLEQFSDEELLERLTAVRGIGRWTVEMILIFNLGRGDIFPIHDAGVRRAYQVAYGKRSVPAEKTLERFGRRFRPYRTAAAWYLWRSLDLPKQPPASVRNLCLDEFPEQHQ